MASKVIIDTDPGIDDAIAIMIARGLKELQVLGITTVSGNVNSKVGAINAMKIVETTGKPSIPVIRGASKPLVKRPVYSNFIHGKGGLGNMILPTDVPLAKTSYLDFMRNTLKSFRKKEISLIAIGPLTNIGQLAIIHPDLLSRLSTIYVMGGAFGLDGKTYGNVTKYAEFNFYFDPEAAQQVMNSAANIKIVGLDVTMNKSCLIKKDFLSKLGKCQGKVAKMAFELLDFSVTKHRFFDLPDAFAVGMAAQPNLFTFTKGKVRITTTGKMRGNSQLVNDKTSNISVAKRVDSTGFNKFVFENLCR